MLALLAMLVALQDVPPPQGVNNIVLGTAEQYRVQGPARVCLADTSVDLRPGENAYLDYLGIHWRSLRIVRGDGRSYLVREGTWGEPRGRVRFLDDWRGRTIVRGRQDGHPAYRSSDRDILDRIIVHRDAPEHCQRRYDGDWDLPPESPGGNR